MAKIKVLFVCLGNICRSPTAEGVFRHLVVAQGLADLIEIDSAGTAAYHVGETPDRRARRAAQRRGISLEDQRSRQATAADCRAYDYVLAMDRSNLHSLQRLCPQAQDRVQLFLDYAPHVGVSDVPDPYYGGPHGFDHVLDLIQAASEGLLAHIKRNDLGMG